MPIIRGRKGHREPSSDRIEDAPTQDETQEDVDENASEEVHDERPRRRGTAQQKSSRHHKGSRKREKIRNGEGSREEEANDAEVQDATDDQAEGAWLDLNNFQNQPLSHAKDGTIFVNMADEWDRFASNWEKSAMVIAPQVAEALAEVGMGKGTERDMALKELEKIDIMMRDFVSTTAEIKSHNEVLVDMRNQLAREGLSDVVNLYTMNVDKKLEEWQSKTTRQKLIGKDDSPYSVFRQKIYEVQHPGEAMPPMTDFISREAGDESDDEDLAIGGSTQNYNCTISLLPMEEPYRSRICNHVFAKDSVNSYFADGRNKKCPAAGCSREQALSDFVFDEEFAKRVKAHLRRVGRKEQEEDDDDTEIIE